MFALPAVIFHVGCVRQCVVSICGESWPDRQFFCCLEVVVFCSLSLSFYNTAHRTDSLIAILTSSTENGMLSKETDSCLRKRRGVDFPGF